jgi:nifR3 family TIM-barrel protein
VAYPNRVLLAPMSGISDRPFRALAARFGAGAVISEMIAGEQLACGHDQARLKAERAGDGPHVVQLAGREQRWMAEGARAAAAAGADVIDINMGCPARKVTGGYSGSALMRDLDHALTLIEATVSATSLPVTLKMRLGWDDAQRNAPELARRAEAAGVKLITVHGRTRCQFYSGAADWAAIRAVKEAVTIPVIANGDLVASNDLRRMLELSGADGVMIGRGARGRPWLPGAMAAYARGLLARAELPCPEGAERRPAPSALPHAGSGSGGLPPEGAAMFALVAEHYEAIIDLYGPSAGIKAARKHIGWYLDQLTPAPAQTLRHALLTETQPRQVLQLLAAAFLHGEAQRAA